MTQLAQTDINQWIRNQYMGYKPQGWWSLIQDGNLRDWNLKWEKWISRDEVQPHVENQWWRRDDKNKGGNNNIHILGLQWRSKRMSGKHGFIKLTITSSKEPKYLIKL